MSDQNNPSVEQEKKAKKKKSMGREIMEWVVTLVVAVVLALVIRTFLFEPVRVDGDSMRNTLHDGEYMIATKFDYLTQNPSRFDVVICKYPNRTETFVKRLIGLPGEKLELREGELYIDDVLVPQNFDMTPNQDNFGPITVPEGRYFVMGDNRDNSNDSRAHAVGPLTRAMIRGHVQYVAFPFNAMRSITGGQEAAETSR